MLSLQLKNQDRNILVGAKLEYVKALDMLRIEQNSLKKCIEKQLDTVQQFL